MRIKYYHVGALVCCVIASVFYTLASLPGAMGFVLFGVLFEGAAWVQVFAGREDEER